MPAGCCIRRVGSWAGHVRQRVIAWAVVLAVSLAWGLAVAVGVYAFMRAVQVLLQPDPDPAQVVWSIHAGYVWRAWTAAYAGGIAAFVVLPMARERAEAFARALVPALGIAAALLALQALLFP
jgi:hypothetical protein